MSARRRVALAIAGVLLGNAVVFAAYTFPRRLRQKSVAERLKTLRAEVERERQQVAERRERIAAARANAEDTQRFYSDVLANRRASLHPLLVSLEGEAATAGLRLDQQIDEEKVQGAPEAAPLERYTIRISVIGTYRQLVTFLERLERSPHFLTVDQVQIRERATGRQATLDILVSAYFRAVGRDGREG